MLAGVGVITHMPRPTVDEGVAVICAAEDAGADWCVVPDAFGWRDVWMMVAAGAAATNTVRIGPGLTNPYTRHPYVTLAAVATLAELAPDRALLGIAAGGSELPRHAGIDRSDAPRKVTSLIEDLRAATAGKPPLPMASSMPEVPILGSARGPKMLDAIAAGCDMVLAFGQPHADIEATADRIHPIPATLGWAPIRRSYGDDGIAAMTYALLNVRESTRRELGLSEEGERRLREVLLAEGFDAAVNLVPSSALHAFLTDDDTETAGATARRLHADCITVLAFDVGPLGDQVEWAREVLDRAKS
jgi:hypothetical protein